MPRPRTPQKGRPERERVAPPSRWSSGQSGPTAPTTDLRQSPLRDDARSLSACARVLMPFARWRWAFPHEVSDQLGELAWLVLGGEAAGVLDPLQPCVRQVVRKPLRVRRFEEAILARPGDQRRLVELPNPVGGLVRVARVDSFDDAFEVLLDTR